MESQYPALGTHHGNYLHTSRATLEPYRSLPPDLKRRAGERTSKKDLSLPEHVCGLLNMALKIMDPTTEEYAAIEPMAQVAQDATTMQWNIVRGWSQVCLAHLEGGATWADSTLFKEERLGSHGVEENRYLTLKSHAQPLTPTPAMSARSMQVRTAYGYISVASVSTDSTATPINGTPTTLHMGAERKLVSN